MNISHRFVSFGNSFHRLSSWSQVFFGIWRAGWASVWLATSASLPSGAFSTLMSASEGEGEARSTPILG